MNWEDAHLLAEIMQRVRDKYVQPVDSKTLMQRASTLSRCGGRMALSARTAA